MDLNEAQLAPVTVVFTKKERLKKISEMSATFFGAFFMLLFLLK